MNDPKSQKCHFKVGQQVRFSPSARTKGLYQDIKRFGLQEDHIYVITEIREGIYLYFREGGGWPFNEFQAVSDKSKEMHKNT